LARSRTLRRSSVSGRFKSRNTLAIGSEVPARRGKLRGCRRHATLSRRPKGHRLSAGGCSRVASVTESCGQGTGTEKTGVVGRRGRTRTCDHLLRRQVLYPPELRARLNIIDSIPFPRGFSILSRLYKNRIKTPIGCSTVSRFLREERSSTIRTVPAGND
jgi:hypothetical protein